MDDFAAPTHRKNTAEPHREASSTYTWREWSRAHLERDPIEGGGRERREVHLKEGGGKSTWRTPPSRLWKRGHLEEVHLERCEKMSTSLGVVEFDWSGSNWRMMARGQRGGSTWSEMNKSERSLEGGSFGGRCRGFHTKGDLEGGGEESTWSCSTWAEVEGRGGPLSRDPRGEVHPETCGGGFVLRRSTRKGGLLRAGQSSQQDRKCRHKFEDMTATYTKIDTFLRRA